MNEIPGGEAQGKKPSDFDPKQLAMGKKVEMEHTNDKDKATEIAMDHLAEGQKHNKGYYTELKKMEEKLEKSAFWSGFTKEARRRPAWFGKVLRHLSSKIKGHSIRSIRNTRAGKSL